MKLLTCFSVLILAGICLMPGPAPASAEDEALVSLLDKVSQRINSYQEMKNYKVEEIEKNFEMNKKWETTKKTIIRRMVRRIDGKVETEFLEVTETENGKTTDVTEKFIKGAEKLNEKTREDAENDPIEKEEEDPTIVLLDNFFPFDETKRSEFDIHRLNDVVMDGKDVFVFESVAKTKDEERFEGTCYIDQKTLDIMKIDVKPSKNPNFVKEMEMEIDFEVLPEGYFVMKKMKAKVEAKIVFKTIRQISETEYVNREILYPDAS